MIFSYGSVCSGIEAATVAWQPLGWDAAWFSEIEAFPSAVLNHHYPDVVNLGDMTKIRDKIKSGDVVAPDLLVGGTPCQAFSVAGARQSLDDDRGQLTLEYVRLLNEIDSARFIRGQSASICVWENVPGVLNTKDNAFGCFLGALAGEDGELKPSGKRWTNSGCVFGPQRAIAWRVLDAQYFGLAQRRKRVFVVASAREGFDPSKILFEWEGLRRDTPPSRSEGQDTTRSVGEGFASSSRAVGALCARDYKGVGNQYVSEGKLILPSDTYNTKTVSGKDIFPTLQASMGSKLWLGNQEAFSGDYFIKQPCFTIPGNWVGRKPENGGNAVEPMNNIAPCQTKADRHAVAYSFDSLASNSMKSKNPISGCREVDLCKTLDTTYPCPSKNQGGLAVVHGSQDPVIQYECALPIGRNHGQENTVFGIQGSMIGRSLPAGPAGSGISENISFTLTKGDRHAVAQSIVRRLTPLECERLQGFPDNYTKIPYRNKSVDDCPDGPRYAACGNSMATNVMEWIGQRIQTYLEAQ